MCRGGDNMAKWKASRSVRTRVRRLKAKYNTYEKQLRQLVSTRAHIVKRQQQVKRKLAKLDATYIIT